MRKYLLLMLMGLFISISTFAWEYTAQCKMRDGYSYVVASQSENSGKVELRGYGKAANCTVVITTVPKKNPNGTSYTYKADIRNGEGSITINEDWRISKVENIVCNL